jgi:hypothetical protein
MALKVGTENKRNVIIVGVLFAIVAILAIYQLTSGPSTPAPTAPAVAQRAPAPQTIIRTTGSAGRAVELVGGSAARKLPGSGLDPALHLEKLALSESIEYAGSGRNIFSADSAPVAIETAAARARPGPQVAVDTGPPPRPQPPPIDLHYFGYSANKDGKREAFLLHGDDIFEAAAGDIVNHRYKVVAVDAHSIQVTDLSYNNTQTLQLTTN